MSASQADLNDTAAVLLGNSEYKKLSLCSLDLVQCCIDAKLSAGSLNISLLLFLFTRPTRTFAAHYIRMSAAPTVQGPPSTASPTLSTEPSSSLEAPQYNQPQHLEQSDPSAAPEPKELSTTPTPLPDIPVTNEGAEEGLSQESKGTEKVGAVGIDVEGSSESLEENVEDTDGAAQALAGVTLSESQRGSAGQFGFSSVCLLSSSR
jgi:hypothetical protein